MTEINLSARRSYLVVIMAQEINASGKAGCVTETGTVQEVKMKTGDFAVSLNNQAIV